MDAPTRRFWRATLVHGAPGLVLLTAAIALGEPVGSYLLLAGVAVLALDIAFALPGRRERHATEPHSSHAPAAFVHGEGPCESTHDLVLRLQSLLKKSVAQDIEVALATNEDGGVVVVTTSQQGPSPRDEDGDASVFPWLGANTTPLWREDLRQAQDVGGSATVSLMDSFKASALVPLHMREHLIGVALVSSAALRRQQHTLLEHCGVDASVMLSNLLLKSRMDKQPDVSAVLARASVMQASLMPQEVLQTGLGWRLQGLCRPATACGGDLWGWFPVSEGKLVVVIGDATGHGAGPALLAAVVKGALDAHVGLKGNACDPGRLLFALNKAVLHTGRRKIMMSAFAIIIDSVKQTIRFANAGHNFPILIRGDKLNALVARGDQLGVSETPVFRTHTQSISPGDRILLYTDGITEAGQEFGKEFGERRFRGLLSASSDQAIESLPAMLLDAAIAHVAQSTVGATIQDDVTMVAIEATKDLA